MVNLYALNEINLRRVMKLLIRAIVFVKLLRWWMSFTKLYKNRRNFSLRKGV